jgi:hypothetical protein
MNRHGEMVRDGEVSIESHVDGNGLAVVVLPSYGRDGGDDFEPFTAARAGSGNRALRPQPRGIARSAGPMTEVALDDLGDDIAALLSASWRDRRRAGRRTDILLGSWAPRATPSKLRQERQAPTSAGEVPACPQARRHSCSPMSSSE